MEGDKIYNSKYEVDDSVGRIIFEEISQSDWRNRQHQDFFRMNI